MRFPCICIEIFMLHCSSIAEANRSAVISVPVFSKSLNLLTRRFWLCFILAVFKQQVQERRNMPRNIWRKKSSECMQIFNILFWRILYKVEHFVNLCFSCMNIIKWNERSIFRLFVRWAIIYFICLKLSVHICHSHNLL